MIDKMKTNSLTLIMLEEINSKNINIWFKIITYSLISNFKLSEKRHIVLHSVFA